MGFSCADVWAVGYRALRIAGFSCSDAKAAGIVQGLRAAGFSCRAAKDAGCALAPNRTHASRLLCF